MSPADALATVISSKKDRTATLALVDRELNLAPIREATLRLEALGRVGLEQVAALPESVVGRVADLTVTRLRPEDGEHFAQIVTAARFPALTRLDVGGQATVAEAALSLLGPGLTDFTYRARGFEASHVAELTAHPLARVALFSLPKDAALPLLSLETLESLRLNFCPLAQKHLKLLTKLSALRELRLTTQELTKATTKSLAALGNLQVLDLSGNDRLDDASLERLGGLAQLEQLTLNDTRAGTKTLAAVAALPLKALHLDKTKIGALGALTGMATLQVLSLVEAAPDAMGWAALGTLTALRRLALTRVRARKGQLEKLTELSALRHLDLAGCGLKAADLGPLSKLAGLRQLNLEGNCGLEDDGLRALQDLALTGLNVSRCKLTAAGLINMAAMGTLEWLAITDNGIDDAAPLGKLARLRWLDVGDNPLGTSARALSALSAMIELSAPGCDLDDGFGAVVAALPKLRRLFVWENALGDGAAEAMARLKGLRLVNLVGNPLTAAGRCKLTEGLPNCTFEW